MNGEGCWVVRVAVRRCARSRDHPLFNPGSELAFPTHRHLHLLDERLGTVHIANRLT